jgi:hypothetical protein
MDKYPIKIFKDNNMACSWNTIKVGWDLHCLAIEEVKKFALEYLEQYPDVINEYISELVFDISESKVSIYLKKIFESLELKEPKKYTSEWNKEWLKWRYCIINEIIKSILDKEELLNSIEAVYADFGYPEDMTEFIYYMPQKDLDHPVSSHEAHNRLVIKLKKFLEKEKVKIDKNSNILPPRVIE